MTSLVQSARGVYFRFRALRAQSERHWSCLSACGAILLLGFLSECIVLGGVQLSETFIQSRSSSSPDVLGGMCRWDGELYRSITGAGYIYDEAHGSRVAFFPAYPITARIVARLCGINDSLALVIVSPLCLFAALLTLYAYLGISTRPADAMREREHGADVPFRTYALLSMALMPTTFFFRMAYSESIFLFAAIVALYTMERRQPLLVVAAVVGFTTAVRPVGIGLLLPLAWNIRKRSATSSEAARRFVSVLPISCWGLLAYMAFQYWRFGQPFAFALTQQHWHLRAPGTIGDKLLSLLSWEPIRNVYTPGTPGYWRASDMAANPLFSFQFANPVYFLGAAALAAFGAWRRWLTAEEFLMSAAFLAIPYFTRAYEMCMASQGRFAAVVFPVYIVIGQLLSRAGTLVAIAVLAFSAFLMAAYAALFAAGYPFF